MRFQDCRVTSTIIFHILNVYIYLNASLTLRSLIEWMHLSTFNLETVKQRDRDNIVEKISPVIYHEQRVAA